VSTLFNVDPFDVDPFDVGNPAGAYDAFLPAARQRSARQRAWAPADGPLPALFVSHGAPPTLDDPVWLGQLHEWAQSLPKPRAILVASAHWERAPMAISATAAATPLYYDFGGFAPRYYTLPYPSPDSTDLAHLVVASMPDGVAVHQFTGRGLDHGAFIPLMAMDPLADVPVLQLSLPTLAPDALLSLGARFAHLREQGILVVGSGFMTHALRGIDWRRPSQLATFNADFDAWATDALGRGDYDALAGFAQAPGGRLAHPTVEHFAPIFFALGAAGGPSAGNHTAINGVAFCNSRRCLQFAGPGAGA
jgi:4,5-DOPA dioxygenase extradiol